MKSVFSLALGRVLLIVLIALAGALPAAAAWRDDIKVLRVGLLVGDNPTYRIAQAEPFRRYLEDRLGVAVELFPATSLGSLIEGQSDDRVDYAIYTATSYAAANAACSCLEPLVVPAGDDGTVGFYAIAVAPSGSAVKAIGDAKGRRLAVAAPDSVAGRLLPLALFAADGMPAKGFFSDLVQTPDPQSAVQAMLEGRADLALAWSSLQGDPASGYSHGVLTRMVADGLLAMSDVAIVWRSPLIPNGPHAVRSDLPDDLKVELGKVLTEMANLDPAAYAAADRSGGSHLVAADPAWYGFLKVLVEPTAAQ